MTGPAVGRLFGRLELDPGTGPVALDSARAGSLLAYLLLHPGEAHTRGRLAALLWPDSTEAQARTNLRHLLHTLRRRSPLPDRLVSTAHTVEWRPDPGDRLDVAEFEELLDTAPDDPPGRRAVLAAAVGLYRADLLVDCDDEWLRVERDRLRHRLLDALTELAGLSEQLGDPVAAIGHAERVLRADPLREPVHRLLMRCHAARGDRGRALRAFHRCVSTLDRELGVEVSAATRAAYEALLPPGPGPAPAQLDGPPLVGRVAERAAMVEAWRSAEAGAARLVLLHGEAGAGKTRLAEEFRDWSARRGAAVAQARCHPAEGPLAYGPVVEWLRSDALHGPLRGLSPVRLGELARLLPELLDERPDVPAPEPLPAGEQQRRLFDAAAAAVAAAGRPLLLVVDDLHHGDRETCRLLHYLVRAEPGSRLLVVATARRDGAPDAHPLGELATGLTAADRLVGIELGPLGAAETAALARRLTGGALSVPDADLLHAETAGNPLFVVEALRAGWVAGAPPSPRVQAVIRSRLSELTAPVADVVGAAAVAGRGFGTDLLAAVTDLDEDPLVRALDELWRRRIVRERPGSGPGSGLADSYEFAHEHIRKVAYADLSPARRRLLHRRTAAALDRAGAPPGRVAEHHDRAGAVDPAVAAYRRAAADAVLLHAVTDAARLLRRALDLLAGTPRTPRRDGTELALLAALLPPLALVGGYSSAAIRAAQDRYVELVNDTGGPFPAVLLRSLALSAMARSDFTAAARHAELLRAAAEPDDVEVAEAAYVLGVAAFWQADLPSARRWFELAVARYRPENRRAHLIRFGQHPKVLALARLAVTHWLLGDPAAAVATRTAALDWAERAGHPPNRAAALTFAALLALDMDDPGELRRHTAALVAALPEAPQSRLVADALAGHLQVLDGDPATGVAAVRAAVAVAAAGQAAPGLHAVLVRVLLAAQLAAPDPTAAAATARHLLTLGGPGRLWTRAATEVGRA